MAGTPRSIVVRYYAYMAASSLGFFVPVWVVFLELQGLTFTQITTLDALFFAAIVVAEVPTGYLGDRIGRRNALVVSSLVLGVAAAAFGFADSFETFLADYLLWAVAQTFRSGNDSAWLYDTLASYGDAADFAAVRGRGFAVQLGVAAVTAVAGGYLFEVDPALPFLVTGATNVLAAAVVATLPEAKPETDERFTLSAARTAIGRLASPSLRSFTLYVALAFGIGWGADIFVQPTATRAGLSPTELGFVYAGLTGVSALASNYAGRVADRFGLGPVVTVTPLVVALVLLAPALDPLLVVPTFLVVRAALSLASPVAEGYLNDRTPSLGRATVLSAFSMAVSLASIPPKLLAGPVADRVGPALTIAGLGALLVVAALAVLAVERPVQEGGVVDPTATADAESKVGEDP